MRSGKAVAMDVHEKWPLSSKEKLVGLLKCTRKILYNRQVCQSRDPHVRY